MVTAARSQAGRHGATDRGRWRQPDPRATFRPDATRWIASLKRNQGLILAAALSLAALPACQSAEPLGRIVTPAEVRSIDPPLNPAPKHIIRLHGRAPESLDFRFDIGFLSTSREGDCWNHAGFWEGGGERVFSYDLYPVRDGENWKADLVVDRYLPGRCEWTIRASAIIHVKPADVPWSHPARSGGMLAVIGDARLWDETAPRCKPGMRNCDEARNQRLSNSDESIPVQVHCRWRVGKDAIGEDMFICNEFADYKDLHYVKGHTRRVRIDLYDHGTTLPPTTGAGKTDP